MGVADLLLAGERDGPAFDEAVDAADSSDIAAAIALATHVDPDVRLAVAQTLTALAQWEEPTTELVQAAILLSGDPDSRVRDWACFVLGIQWCEVDTDAVREALAARLDDDDGETRCGALLGLANRRDPRALPRVRAALARPSGDLWRLELIAAGALSDPQLHDLVLRHLTGWDDDDDPLPVADLVRRLTDPAGAGEEVLEGVADLYRRRAHAQPDGDALGAWHVLSGMLEIAPHRAAEFLGLVLARLVGDEAAVHELLTNSALAVDGG